MQKYGVQEEHETKEKKTQEEFACLAAMDYLVSPGSSWALPTQR